MCDGRPPRGKVLLFPWIGCAVYVIPHRFSWDFDRVLAGYQVTSLIFSWASVRYHAFDPVPVAREAVLEQMAEGVAAVDLEDRTSIARFAPGDVLFRVSDGVTECSRNGEPFGMDRLKAIAFRELSGAAEPDLSGIIASVGAYRSEGVQEDDMCFLAMSVRREGGPEK